MKRAIAIAVAGCLATPLAAFRPGSIVPSPESKHGCYRQSLFAGRETCLPDRQARDSRLTDFNEQALAAPLLSQTTARPQGIPHLFLSRHLKAFAPVYVGVLLLALDQLSKGMIRHGFPIPTLAQSSSMPSGEAKKLIWEQTHWIWKGWVGITRVESLDTNIPYAWFRLAILAAGFSRVAYLNFVRHWQWEKWGSLFLGFMIIGSANVIDVLHFQSVTDWIVFPAGSVGNVADLGIFAFLLVLYGTAFQPIKRIFHESLDRVFPVRVSYEYLTLALFFLVSTLTYSAFDTLSKFSGQTIGIISVCTLPVLVYVWFFHSPETGHPKRVRRVRGNAA